MVAAHIWMVIGLLQVLLIILIWDDALQKHSEHSTKATSRGHPVSRKVGRTGNEAQGMQGSRLWSNRLSGKVGQLSSDCWMNICATF